MKYDRRLMISIIRVLEAEEKEKIGQNQHLKSTKKLPKLTKYIRKKGIFKKTTRKHVML